MGSWVRQFPPMSQFRDLRRVVLGLVLAATLPAAEGLPRAQVPDKHRDLFKQNCVSCHGAEKQKGHFRVDDLPYAITTVEGAARWQKVLNALNAGDMPPEDKKPLDKSQKVELLDDLANTLVVARQVLNDQDGQITVRRLNRREYQNTIRDLLGVQINVGDLPSDAAAGSFDTVGSGLFMSSSQFDGYRTLGRQALDAAFALYVAGAKVQKVHIEPEVKTNPAVQQRLDKRIDDYRRYQQWIAGVDAAAQRPENQEVVARIRAEKKNDRRHLYASWQRISGASSPTLFGFTDAEHADHDGIGHWQGLVPYHRSYTQQPALATGTYLSIGRNADNAVNPYEVFDVPHHWPAGDYVIRVRIAATDNTPPERHFVTLGPRALVTSTHHVTGTMADPQVIDIPVAIPPGGNRTLSFSEKGTLEPDEQGARIYDRAFRENGVGPAFALWIDWIEVEGPLNVTRGVPPALDGVHFPASADVADDAVRGMLERFARHSFRGTAPSERYLDRLLSLYRERRAAGEKPEIAIREPLSVVLSSPHFLYVAEPAADGKRRTVTDLELATRLSYFLWRAPPDAALLAQAQRGDLNRSEVLHAEIDRLLTSPKAMAFVTGFTAQWLGMDRLDFFQFNQQLFPEFCKSVKTAAKEEVFQTVAWLLRENRSLRHLLKSDVVVVDAVMATYYGLDGVRGDEFRPVTLPAGSPRGGLLGMAGILAMGGNGEHTSPVERGAWVLRKLLHNPPPPAPPNVPQLMRLEGKLLTTRERIAAHQEEPQCASCHRKIDPIGFGLENFDAAGRWRTSDSFTAKGAGQKSWTIDPAGAFHNGPAFRDFFELRDLIAARGDDFAQGFTEALVAYALGRPCGFSDHNLVEAVRGSARAKDYALREFIHGLVSNPAFRLK